MADESRRPRVVVVGGPNGAGKTTTATSLMPDDFDIRHFVNADTIAAGLSAFDPESVALQAGRLMLARIDELVRERQDFTFETTLASRSFAPFLRSAQQAGYFVLVIYVWLRSPELAIQRVAARVQRGGHFVPDDVVRRRYTRGMANFAWLYRPLADAWILCDNTGNEPTPVAAGGADSAVRVYHQELLDEFEARAKQA